MLFYGESQDYVADGQVAVPTDRKEIKPVIIPVEEFDGECQKNGTIYTVILWAVSFLALITNTVRALPIFIKRRFFQASPENCTPESIAEERKKNSFGAVLWEMGRSENHYSSWFVDRFSKVNHQAKVYAASWGALDVFYNYRSKYLPSLKGIGGMLTRYWGGRMENRQAVDNRKRIIVKLLINAAKKFINEKEIRLYSVASGSAEAVIELLQAVPNLPIKVVLIDNDKTAMDMARENVAAAGLLDRFKFVRGKSSLLEKVCQKYGQPHIVEMAGFLDYRSDKSAVSLISRIREQLQTGGIFITCNIIPNKEKIFLSWVLLWPMIYRTAKRFNGLLTGSGFSPTNIELYSCPLMIHAIGVCRK